MGGSIEGVKLADHAQACIGVSAGPLKLSSVSISGSDLGIFAQSDEDEVTSITVERSTFREMGKYAVYARGAVDIALKDCDFNDISADSQTKTVDGGAIRTVQDEQ